MDKLVLYCKSFKNDIDRVSILVESIISHRELRSDGEIKNFRFKLHNGHSFDLVY